MDKKAMDLLKILNNSVSVSKIIDKSILEIALQIYDYEKKLERLQHALHAVVNKYDGEITITKAELDEMESGYLDLQISDNGLILKNRKETIQ